MSLPPNADQTDEMEVLAAQYPPAIVNKVIEIRATKERIAQLQEEVTTLRAELGGVTRDDPGYNATICQQQASRSCCKAIQHKDYHNPACTRKRGFCVYIQPHLLRFPS